MIRILYIVYSLHKPSGLSNWYVYLWVICDCLKYIFLFFECNCFSGHGKTPKDAASVRATHPIPAACGIYYFEVKIVSKGRDG